MNPILASSILKAGATGILAALLWYLLYLGHQERADERREAREQIMPVLKNLAESLESIAETYQGH
jgi:hypothetical protein